MFVAQVWTVSADLTKYELLEKIAKQNVGEKVRKSFVFSCLSKEF